MAAGFIFNAAEGISIQLKDNRAQHQSLKISSKPQDYVTEMNSFFIHPVKIKATYSAKQVLKGTGT